MSYQLRVLYGDDSDSHEYDFFYRFMKESGYLEDETGLSIDHFLAPYNGRNCPHEPYIEFDTEEDAVAFKLMWL